MPDLGLPRHLREAGFATLTAPEFELSETQLVTLRQVFDEELAPDQWLPAGQVYRDRAYQCFHLNLTKLTFTPLRKPPPYVQSRSVNPLSGGIERYFRLVPIDHPAVGVVSHVAKIVVDFLLCAEVLCAHLRSDYTVDVHYIRITAPGKPSPEGIHRDGLIAGSIHVVRRVNVSGGTTSVFNPSGVPLRQFSLTEPFDSLLWDDSRVLHCTDDVSAVRPDMPAYRDVLLIGVRS